MWLPIHIEIGRNVQRHASVQYNHGRVQEPCFKSEYDLERCRSKRENSDNWILAYAIIDAKLHNSECTATSF